MLQLPTPISPSKPCSNEKRGTSRKKILTEVYCLTCLALKIVCRTKQIHWSTPPPPMIYLSIPHIWPTCNHRSWVIMISMCALTREDGLHNWKPCAPPLAFSFSPLCFPCLSCSFWGIKLGGFTLKIVGMVQVEPGLPPPPPKKKKKKKTMWILQRVLLGKKRTQIRHILKKK